MELRNLILAIGSAGLVSQAAAEDAATARGLEIAKAHCSRCHIIDEANRFGGISSTPSFKTLLTALPDWKDRFETFYARNPHPSVVRIEEIVKKDREDPSIAAVELKLADIEAIVAYVESYRSRLEQ